MKDLKEGEVLFEEQSYVQTIPVVVSGSIKIYQTDEEYREMLLYYLRGGETCIMSVLGEMFNEKNRLKAVANEPSQVLLIPAYKVGTILKNMPEWTEYLLNIYYQRFQELLEVVNAIAFKKMDERLLTYLKNKSEVMDSGVLEVTHEEIARELGTARVVISRLLKQLEKEKRVELGRNRITLL